MSADARALEAAAPSRAAIARDEALGLPAGALPARGGPRSPPSRPRRSRRVARRLLDPRLEIVAVVRPPLAPTIAKAAPPKAVPKAGGAWSSSTSTSGGRRLVAP